MGAAPDDVEGTEGLDPVETTTLRVANLAIEVAEGPDAGRVTRLARAEIRVGRGNECDLVLRDGTVSLHHVTLLVRGHSVRVIDAGSRNGTMLDGCRVVDAFAREGSLIVVGRSTLRIQILDEEVALPLSPRTRFGSLFGRSVAMRRVFTVLERFAGSTATLLVEGETGTGKELVAEAIHETSPRASGPFIIFDCSALSPSLVESELFGHLRGAFTGAVTERLGAFEAADGGTLFLDEIGELPLDLQPKLLRALERHEVRRIGQNEARRVDVRVVAATNRSLAAEVDAGRFREDLSYRLAVLRVSLPPLRERPEDIPLLIEKMCRELGCAPSDFPQDLQQSFAVRAWPGNVRELRNAITRALSLRPPGGVAAPMAASTATSAVELTRPLKVGREEVADAYERDYLIEAFRRTGGNVTRTAELAGVSRKFVQRALVKYPDLRGAVDENDDGS